MLIRKLASNLDIRGGVLLLIVALVVLSSSSAFAQVIGANATQASNKNASGSNALAFDVVSIRPSGPGLSYSRIESLPDGYRAVNMPLISTIMKAYIPFLHTSDDSVRGAPSWVTSTNYDFIAKVAPADVAKWQSVPHNMMQKDEMLEVMLQAVLRERCKLVVHRIPKDVTGYALVLGKHGPKLESAKLGEPVSKGGMLLPGGGMVIASEDNQGLTFTNTSMASFTEELMLLSRGPMGPALIQDRTGLTGKYDFVVRKLGSGSSPDRQEGMSASDPTFGLPWDIAELGLLLKPAKVQTETVVIDHIERPSPN